MRWVSGIDCPQLVLMRVVCDNQRTHTSTGWKPCSLEAVRAAHRAKQSHRWQP